MSGAPFDTELDTAKPAVFALSAATRVRKSALFDPIDARFFRVHFNALSQCAEMKLWTRITCCIDHALRDSLRMLPTPAWPSCSLDSMSLHLQGWMLVDGGEHV